MTTRLFYCSDVHGSQVCFQKFLNAGKFYKANVLIMGGDISGKAVVPITRKEDSYTTSLLGIERVAKGTGELGVLEKKIADMGMYYYVGSPNEVERLRGDPSRLDQVFLEQLTERLQKWLDLAAERLPSTDIRCFIMPGNDDRSEAIKSLEASDQVSNPDRSIIELDSAHEMISLGYANMTPWKCPRDVPEEKLATMIEELTSQVKNLKNSVFNIHIPPFDSGIDVTTKLDENLRPVMTSSGPQLIAAGSTAVRSAIENHGPLLGLHGHIHESRGTTKIGRTLCLNPGSEYSEGVLRGAIVELGENKIKSYLLVSG